MDYMKSKAGRLKVTAAVAVLTALTFIYGPAFLIIVASFALGFFLGGAAGRRMSGLPILERTSVLVAGALVILLGVYLHSQGMLPEWRMGNFSVWTFPGIVVGMAAIWAWCYPDQP